MASMLERVTEARLAATRRWDSARRAAFGDSEPNPETLAQLLEADIIPRLLLAHGRRPGSGGDTGVSAAISPACAAEFAAATLTEDASALLARADALLDSGISVEALFLHLITPAARQLGAWWDDDACDFVDVTMGLWRCQEVVHALSARVPYAMLHGGAARRVLMAPAPGEQHGLGAQMVAEFFRRAGWLAWSAPAGTDDALLAIAAAQPFDVIGLTISADRHLPGVPPLLARLRAVSPNPDVVILVGGGLFASNPALARQLGADGTAADGPGAVACAESLLDRAAPARLTGTMG
ncbi:MAG: hypothetical protein RL490_1105 [Pseudomonadota bacterium]|jgi:methanogenic corrinoid protein MtbC1